MSEDTLQHTLGTPAQEEVDKKISIGIEITQGLQQKALSGNVSVEDLHRSVRDCLECNPIDPKSKPPMMHFAFFKEYRPHSELNETIIVNQTLREFLELPDRGEDGWYQQDEVVKHFAKRSFPENATAQESVLEQSKALTRLIQTLNPQTTIRSLPHLLFTVTRNKNGVITHSPLITYAFVITRNKRLVGVLYVSDRVHNASLSLEKYERRVGQGFLVYPTAPDFYNLSKLAKIDLAEYDHAKSRAVQAVERSVKHGDDLPNSIFENYQEKKLASQKTNHLTEHKQSDRDILLHIQKSELELSSGDEILAATPSGSLAFGQSGEEGKSLDGIARIQFLEGLILESNGLTISQLVELCNEIQAVPLPEDVAQCPEFKGCRNPKKHMDAYKIAALTKAQQVVRNLSKDIENAIRRVQNIPQNEKHTLNIYPVGGSPNTTKGPHGKILITDQYIPCRTSITLSELTAPLFSHLFEIAKTNPSEQPRNSSDLRCE
jgi:hypothetical protein